MPHAHSAVFVESALRHIAAQGCAAQGLQSNDDFAYLAVGFHVLMCFDDIIKGKGFINQRLELARLQSFKDKPFRPRKFFCIRGDFENLIAAEGQMTAEYLNDRDRKVT